MSDIVSNLGVISSVIVQARPQALATISTGIGALSGAEVHADDPAGKLIVVTETESDAELTELIDQIRTMKGVLGVNLVFHHNELAPADDFKGSWRG